MQSAVFNSIHREQLRILPGKELVVRRGLVFAQTTGEQRATRVQPDDLLRGDLFRKDR
jgi:hypothetical protein